MPLPLTTHRPATDLGFLLRKNPARAQTFDLPFGEARVFYPEAGEGAAGSRGRSAAVVRDDFRAAVRG